MNATTAVDPLSETSASADLSRNPVALIHELACDGIQLWVEDGCLKYAAYGAAPTRLQRDLMEANKDALLVVLGASPPEPPRVLEGESAWIPAETQTLFVRDPFTSNVESSFLFRGRFDLPAFSSALQTLLHRHSLLRSRYVDGIGGQLWAVTSPSITLPTSVFDFRHLDSNSRENAVHTTRVSIVDAALDIWKGPLLRVAIFLLEEELTQVVFAFHHSIFDAESGTILASELRALYPSDGQAPGAVPPTPTQYRDAVEQHREWEQSAEGRQHIEYWRRRLRDVSSLGWLPPDRRTPVGDTSGLPCFQGGIYDDELIHLRDLARQEGVTLFTVAYCAFAIVMWRWSGIADVCTSLMHHGRRRPEHFGIIGSFNAFWPLHVALKADTSFNEALRRVRRSYVEALPHGGVSIRNLIPFAVRICKGKLYPTVLFNYQTDITDSASNMERLRDSSPAGPPCGRLPEHHTFVLTVDMIESDRSLVWTFTHSSHKFEEDTVGRASQCLTSILRSAPRTPDLAISQMAKTPICLIDARLPR